MQTIVTFTTICVLLCLTFVSGARAQYHWHVTHDAQLINNGKAQYEYLFTAVDCSGDVCTAAGVVLDTSIHAIGRSRVMFFRSSDQGRSWVEQDPQLPPGRGDKDRIINLVQQIDSLNAVAFSDSGLVLRTFDGGLNWVRQDLHTLEYVDDVNFSDPLTGIAITDRVISDSTMRACRILTTTDGGHNWKQAAF